MKRFLLMVVGAAMLVACGGEEKKSALSPEEVVATCWERVANGDVAGAVALMDAAEGEKEIFAESLLGAYEALGEMESKPTFEAIEVSVEGDVAIVRGRVACADGRSLESEYRLVKCGGRWLIAE